MWHVRDDHEPNVCDSLSYPIPFPKNPEILAEIQSSEPTPRPTNLKSNTQRRIFVPVLPQCANNYFLKTLRGCREMRGISRSPDKECLDGNIVPGNVLETERAISNNMRT